MKTILLIAQDPLRRRLIRRITQELGLMYIDATTAVEAKRVFHDLKESLDAVLLPGRFEASSLDTTDSLAFLAEMRAAGYTKLILSISTTDSPELVAAGCDDSLDLFDYFSVNLKLRKLLDIPSKEA